LGLTPIIPRALRCHPTHFPCSDPSYLEIIVDGVDLLEEVRKSKVKDDEVVKAVEEMKRAGVKMLRDEE